MRSRNIWIVKKRMLNILNSKNTAIKPPPVTINNNPSASLIKGKAKAFEVGRDIRRIIISVVEQKNRIILIASQIID